MSDFNESEGFHEQIVKTYTLGGCSLLLQLFSLEWTDFKAANLRTDLVPKIAVYSSEMMDELIKLVEEDRQRSDGHRRYKRRPQGTMNGPPMRWHPMIVPSTEMTAAECTMGVKEGMDNIMLVIEETVMPMMMDAILTVGTEMSQANRGSIIEEFFSKADEHKKRLQFCFGSKLYPDVVRISGSLKATKDSDGSSSRGVYVEEHRGTSSRGLPGMEMDVEYVPCEGGAAGVVAVDGYVPVTCHGS